MHYHSIKICCSTFKISGNFRIMTEILKHTLSGFHQRYVVTSSLKNKDVCIKMKMHIHKDTILPWRNKISRRRNICIIFCFRFLWRLIDNLIKVFTGLNIVLVSHTGRWTLRQKPKMFFFLWNARNFNFLDF